MGLFDGFDAGWNSFKNNELKTITNVAFAPNPIVEAITNPKKAIDDPASVLPIEIGSKGPVVKDAGETWKETGNDAVNTLFSPNPIISAATGNTEDVIPGGKTATEKWDNVTSSVDEKVVTPVKETVQETITNVTKGLGDALPILAIGGAAVLVVSLLLGRR
jgi:hypothetical protein